MDWTVNFNKSLLLHASHDYVQYDRALTQDKRLTDYVRAVKFLACVALTGRPDGNAQGVLLSPKSYAFQVSRFTARCC